MRRKAVLAPFLLVAFHQAGPPDSRQEQTHRQKMKLFSGFAANSGSRRRFDRR
jgi:hypothetical protein